jgi:hypothetical protein
MACVATSTSAICGTPFATRTTASVRPSGDQRAEVDTSSLVNALGAPPAVSTSHTLRS